VRDEPASLPVLGPLSTRSDIQRFDAAIRLKVREYLASGGQPQDGPTLITRVAPERTLVIAKDSAGCVLWAFFITGAKGPKGNLRLYSIGGAYLIGVEREEAKANPWSFQSS
jgi:hypothetical protein